MNAHALAVLEFDKVVRMLVERTSFEPASEAAARLAPIHDPETIRERLALAAEARSLLDQGGAIPLGRATDIRDAVVRSSREGAMLSPGDLAAVAGTLGAVGDVRRALEARREACPRVWRIADALCPDDRLVDAIHRAVDPETLEVRDSASRELARIRRAIGSTRSKLDEKLATILDSASSADAVQEAAVHIRNGRRVLPVKRTARAKIRGIVHDQSASGSTVFVEPLATVPLNNELAQLAAAERDEIERVLRALTADVGARAADLSRSVVALGELDYARASAVLSRDLDCVAAAVSDTPVIRLRSARHPVLAAVAARSGGRVVPLDLDLGPGATTVVISGPNAGGKTVALKTAGLLALMTQCGLHVPAAPGTELGVFRDVFADIGDEQSIERSLSSFSSHLTVVREILDEADAGVLVLLDELGAGTDPDEGSALAIAILEDLTARAAPTVATTHLGSVKIHVHDREGMTNASMSFDPNTLEPTFRLVTGVPGASHGLAIAEARGLPGRVTARARALRDQGAAMIDGLLVDLAERQRALAAALERARVDEERARLLAADHEERLAAVKEERRRIRQEALDEARGILDGATSLVEEIVRELRAKDAAREAIKAARQKLERRRAEAARAADESRRVEKPDAGAKPASLVPGMRVRVASLGREGELLSPPDGKGKVRVRIRSAEVAVDASDLREPDRATQASAPRAEVVYVPPEDEAPATELMLLGMRTDEIGDAIDRFVSSALVQGLEVVRIVHGKGTGALRTKTHELLRGHPSVKSFRLGRWGEGDTGVTIVELA
ncbi:MAG: endonuclease MutS2 [Candidatus Eisenbacteria bacterium]|nr:endonuclease MutS2 [Candidatus Eisenbacteria bacterium]